MRLFGTLFSAAFLLFMSTSFAGKPSEEILVQHFHDAATGKMVRAALDGNAKKVDRMLANGAKINARADEGLTPLILAVMQKNKRAVEILLDRNANPNLLADKGRSAMSEAAEAKEPWFLEQLIKHGGDPNLDDLYLGETPVFPAAKYGLIENMHCLIAAGAKLNHRDGTGQTAIINAAQLNQYEAAWVLLEAGANPMIKDNFGTTIMYEIQHYGYGIKGGTMAMYRDRIVEWLKQRQFWRLEKTNQERSEEQEKQ